MRSSFHNDYAIPLKAHQVDGRSSPSRNRYFEGKFAVLKHQLNRILAGHDLTQDLMPFKVSL